MEGGRREPLASTARRLEYHFEACGWLGRALIPLTGIPLPKASDLTWLVEKGAKGKRRLRVRSPNAGATW